MIGPRHLEELEELACSVGDVAHSLGYRPDECISDSLSRLADAIEAQTKVQQLIGLDICASISGVANRIEDSFTGTDGIIGVLSEIRNALSGVTK